jgi:hypothetical protein
MNAESAESTVALRRCGCHYHCRWRWLAAGKHGASIDAALVVMRPRPPAAPGHRFFHDQKPTMRSTES